MASQAVAYGGLALGPVNRKRKLAQTVDEPASANVTLATLDVQEARDRDMQHSLHLIEQQARQESALQCTVARHEEEVMREWACTNMESEEFHSAPMPSHSGEAGAVLVPGMIAHSLQCVQWVLPGQAMAERVLSEGSATFKSELEKIWHENHHVLLPDGGAAPKVDESTSLCFSAGFCVCHRKSLRLFVGNLMVALRPLFMSTQGHISYLRKYVDSNMVILRVYDSALRQEKWVHIADVNLSTWHGAAMPVLLDERRRSQAEALGRIAVHLATELPFLGLCNWWELLCGLRPSMFICCVPLDRCSSSREGLLASRVDSGGDLPDRFA